MINPTFDRNLYWKAKKKKDIFTGTKFSKDIVEKAEEIYHAMEEKVKVKRREPLKMLQFTIFYYAHHELEIIFDPRDLAEKIGLASNRMSAAITKFGPVQTGYTSSMRVTTKKEAVCNLVMANSYKFGLSETAVDEIIAITESVWDRSERLVKKGSRTIAAGVINYYLKIHGYTCDVAQFSISIGVSSATITDSSKEIEKCLC